MPEWIPGRQNDGYYKMPLLVSARFRFDCYLLKFDPGYGVGEHLDPVNSGRHFRFNLIIKPCRSGGKTVFNNEPIFNFGIAYLFRPDIVRHSMTEVEGSSLYMLSIGKVL